MSKILFVDSKSLAVRRSSGRRLVERVLERVERVEGIERAEKRLRDRPGGFGAVLFNWEPKEGLERVGRVVEISKAAGLEAVLLISRRLAADIEGLLEAGVYWVVTAPCDELHLRRVLKAAVETGELRRGLSRTDQECELLLDRLQSGRFCFRTPREARILAERLGSRCPEPQASVALLELMVNAIEHGNLGIDYRQKGALLAEGLFEAEVAQRLEDPAFRDLRARLELERKGGVLDLFLTDCGPGFDWSRFLKMDDDRILDLHGRGILLANATLSIEYLAPGNKVRIQMPVEAT